SSPCWPPDRTRPPPSAPRSRNRSSPADSCAAATTTPQGCPMIVIDIETKRKLREMGATALLEAIDAQDESQVLGMSFTDRFQLVVDEAHASFNHAKVEGLIRRAGLRYPGADLRRLDLVAERGLDRHLIAQLATCSFIQ